MSQKTCEVIFSGRLVEGAPLEKVKANVAALFKVEVAKVERLFSGGAVVIKKGVDAATAKKYQMALHKAGALCKVVDRAAVARKAPAGGNTAAPAAPTPATPRSPAPTASSVQKSVVMAPPKGLGELSAAGVDAPGTTLVEQREVAAPQIDTSGLSMDQVGAELVEHEEVPELQVDIADLSMGEAGEVLAEEKPFVPLQVDTSSLSLDDPA